MVATTPKVSITGRAVENAVKRATSGEEAEIKDATCRGLSLRLRAGRVTWTIRWEITGRYRRWTIGASDVLPDEARRRAWEVKSRCQQGIDPTPQVIAWITGVPIHRQPAKGVKSVSWESARSLFLDHIKRTRRPATHDDYRAILENTPEIVALNDKTVAEVTEFDIAALLSAVSKRTEAHAEHVQRVLSSMWTFLAGPEHRPTTGVTPGCIRHVRAPERTRREIGDYNPDYTKQDSVGPPDRLEIGRYMAIARLGVFGARTSAALLLLAGSAQRRRPVAGAHAADFSTFDGEWLWSMPPYFRKTARKKRSSGKHQVPLIGFAAEAAAELHRLGNGQGWLLPAARARRLGQVPKQPHIDPRSISEAIESMPGVSFSAHGFRAALATYGSEDLGWAPADSKIILDHMEGFDPGDVTAQHYNTDPAIAKKRAMMSAWTSWLEQRAADAIAADPTLLDREAVAEQVYRIRYGDDAWKRACDRKVRPWQDIKAAVE
jgi:Arm DNA-binding domain